MTYNTIIFYGVASITIKSKFSHQCNNFKITKKHQIKNIAVNFNKMKEKINDVYRRKLFGNFPKCEKKNQKKKAVNVYIRKCII